MAKFKVGDKVRVVETKHDCKKHLVGKAFIVKKSFKGVGNNYVYDVGEEYLLNEPELAPATEYKFKVGDKVRFIRTMYDFKEDYIGKEFTIKHAYSDGSYSIGQMYLAWDNELELVKPKFDYKAYPGKYAIHVTTEEQANIFVKYMTDVMGLHWYSNCFRVYKEETHYIFNEDCYVSKEYCTDNSYTTIEFEDFDWSDFTMKKEFTKADLKEFDIVKLRNGEVFMVLRNNQSRDGLSIFNKKSWGCKEHLHSYDDDLLYSGSRCENDIVAVKKFDGVGMYNLLDKFFTEGRTLYMWDWERTEVEEMTLEEVCKALGKDIKIVKEK